MCQCVKSQREFPPQEHETFDSSRKESSSLLSLMWSVYFSLFSFTLSSFFSVSSWFIARVVFHPIRSSVPAYLLCVPTDGFVCLCVWALVSWPSDYSVLCWGNTRRLWKYAVHHGTVTWTCVFYPCTMAPRRYFSGVATVQSPTWRSHPLETNQSPGCRVGTSVLLLSCFCLLENRIYLAFLKCAVDEGSLLKAPPQATRNI